MYNHKWEMLMNVCSICCQLEQMHKSEDEEHMQKNLAFWLFDDFAKIKEKKYICRAYLHNFGEDEREKSSKRERSWNRRRTARLLRTLCGPWIIIFIIIIIINFIIIIILIINIFNNHHDYSRGKLVWRVMRTWTALTLLLVSWITKMNKWNCFEK